MSKRGEMERRSDKENNRYCVFENFLERETQNEVDEKIGALSVRIDIQLRDILNSDLDQKVGCEECPYEYLLKHDLEFSIDTIDLTEEEADEHEAKGFLVGDRYRRSTYALIKTRTHKGPVMLWHLCECVFYDSHPCAEKRDVRMQSQFNRESVWIPLTTEKQFEDLLDAMYDADGLSYNTIIANNRAQ